ncbi:hypothetical protein BV900_28090 [Agrobacterium tumefaciens]|nr:hypothetical protein BV900_28090 [Agrobacterium tumefaciens]
METFEDDNASSDGLPSISLRSFLESKHPSLTAPVAELWQRQRNSQGSQYRAIPATSIKLHCKTCDGERTFRSEKGLSALMSDKAADFVLKYRCGDCLKEHKLYYLHAEFEEGGGGSLYKYGELPPFGIPLANKVLRLFGKDATLIQKGRQCENLGYGVAAFAYYRRVVENHKNDIFDEIIKVCRTVNAPESIIQELEQAKKEIAFTKAIEAIKTALPQGLLINGHNPLVALHGALSVGLHEESDEECLAAAQ